MHCKDRRSLLSDIVAALSELDLQVSVTTLPARCVPYAALLAGSDHPTLWLLIQSHDDMMHDSFPSLRCAGHDSRSDHHARGQRLRCVPRAVGQRQQSQPGTLAANSLPQGAAGDMTLLALAGV